MFKKLYLNLNVKCFLKINYMYIFLNVIFNYFNCVLKKCYYQYLLKNIKIKKLKK